MGGGLGLGLGSVGDSHQLWLTLELRLHARASAYVTVCCCWNSLLARAVRGSTGCVCVSACMRVLTLVWWQLQELILHTAICVVTTVTIELQLTLRSSLTTPQETVALNEVWSVTGCPISLAENTISLLFLFIYFF